MADKSPDRKELQAKWKAETDVPELSLADVAKHKSPSDLWIVIHNKGMALLWIEDQPGDVNNSQHRSVQCDGVRA